jgi:hypothetical protein
VKEFPRPTGVVLELQWIKEFPYTTLLIQKRSRPRLRFLAHQDEGCSSEAELELLGLSRSSAENVKIPLFYFHL